MGQLLQQALTPKVLNSAWKRLRNEKTVWNPGVDRATLERDFVHHILTLVDDLRSGHYRPAPLRQFTITKGDGKPRHLTALALRDKVAQRAILTVIDPLGERLFLNDSYGYRPGRNVEMAYCRACERIRCGQHWLVDADIQSFFDQIPHRRLRRMIKRYIRDRELRALIDLWLVEGRSSVSILRERRGIAQGSILSPFLCNLYLHELDVSLTRKNIPFVRFADDFLLFARSENEAQQALTVVKTILSRMKLTLHPEKTQVIQSRPNVVFLGKPLPRLKIDRKNR